MTLRPQTQMLGAVLEFGHDQLDTCAVYGDGTCEQMLGDLRAAEQFGIATRIHSGAPFQEWIDDYHQNTIAAVRLLHAFTPAMKERGWGRLIQV
jgi:aryl-alcohol dehydrogenase-like predicted oxidoreductase